MYRVLLTTVFASGVLLGLPACGESDCPVGQVLYDGECVDLVGSDPQCGPGTYNDNGICRPHEDLCGINTEVVWVVDASGIPTGEFHCEGQSTSDVPPCPDSPDGQLICVSGWAKYFQDPESPCDIMQTPILFGPDATQIEVAVYDPLAYAAAPDPSTVAPLGVADVDPVSGTWKVEDITVPATNFIAVVVRSIEPGTEFIFTGFPYEAAPGVNLEKVNAYGITDAQNASWSAAIGDSAIAGASNCTSGDTLYDCGTWIGVFGYENEGGSISFLEGVVPLNGSGTPPPPIPISNMFFLDDSCEDFVQPASATDSYTTSTGVAFMPGANLGNFSGTCSDQVADSECNTSGYEFPVRLGGAAPQAIFVQLEYPVGHE